MPVGGGDLRFRVDDAQPSRRGQPPVSRQVVAGDPVRNGKLHPEGYIHGAALLTWRPEGCLVIEDAAAGVRAGKLAGCQVLAVASSHHTGDLEGAAWIVASLDQPRVKFMESATHSKSIFPLSCALADSSSDQPTFILRR